MGRKKLQGQAIMPLQQALPSHLLKEQCLPLGDFKQVQLSASAPPRDMLGVTRGYHSWWLEQTPHFGGLQPVLGCSCPNSGTRHHSQCPVGFCLFQKDSGLLVSCQSSSDTPGHL